MSVGARAEMSVSPERFGRCVRLGVTAVTKEDKVPQVALTFPCSECPLGLVQEQPEPRAQSPLSQQRSDPPKGPLHLTHQESSSNTAPFGE